MFCDWPEATVHHPSIRPRRIGAETPEHSSLDESTLIARSQQGDTDAFNMLILSYQQLAFNTAFRILGHEDAAADATQEAFLSTYESIRGFRGGSFRAWLLRIVANACYDELRRTSRHPAAPLEGFDGDQECHFHQDDRREAPEEYLLSCELAEVIQRGLNSLRTEQRLTLVLADMEDVPYAEIAQIMGVREGTVKSRVSRARVLLRGYFLHKPGLLAEIAEPHVHIGREREPANLTA